MLKRNLTLMSLIILSLMGFAACSTPIARAVENVLPTATTTPAPLAPLPKASPGKPGAGLSGAQAGTIRGVIQQANQEQARALAAHDPTIMQDTSTTAYYQQSVQILNDLLNSGVTAIQLVNLQWGAITLQNGSTAQATTSETWSTTFSDGSTMNETDTNVYTLVLENGDWKVQDDQHPNVGKQQPSAPGGPVAPISPAPARGARSQSRNWSGYAATGSNFTAVLATWTVPNVNAGTTGMDATWIGIGGVSSRDLIQAGTQAEVRSGQVSYSAFWETLPQASQDVPLTIAAGDTVNVSITRQPDGTWQIRIRDATNSQSWEKTVTYQSSMSSAEWIEEAPSTGRLRLLPLDEFGSITFANGTTVENGQTRTIGQAGGQPITMGFGVGQVLAQPSALGSDGEGFTVTRTNVTAPSLAPGRRNFPTSPNLQ